MTENLNHCNIEKIEKEIEKFKQLADEINKQFILNIKELELRKKSKEDKLPRKLRVGWK